MTAPSGTCSAVAAAMAADQRRSAAGAPGMRRATTQVSTATTITMPDRTRLEYSISAWPACAGTTPPSQSGQSGQPSPDAVRRTTAPLGTIAQSRASATSVSRAKAVGARRARRRRIGPHRSRGARCQTPRMPRPDDPPSTPVAIPDRRRRIGLVAGIAIIAAAIGVAVAFGLSGNGDAGRLVTAVVTVQDEEVDDPPPAVPPDAAGGGGFRDSAALAGWTPVGARADTVEGVAVTTVFWGRAGRRVAHTVLPGDAPPPDGARRTGRRGVLLYSFDSGPRTAVTWTENGRTSVISAIAVNRGELYDLAGGPPRSP